MKQTCTEENHYVQYDAYREQLQAPPKINGQIGFRGFRPPNPRLWAGLSIKCGTISKRRGAAMQTQEKLALEDNFTDVLGKSQRGLKLTVEEIAERADLPVDTIQALKQGRLDRDALQRLAFVLNLHPASLVTMAENRWEPKSQPALDGFAMFTTNYGDMTVNAYLIWDPQTKEAASFDTGSTCQPMLDHLNAKSLKLTRIFITHTHMDHLADLDRLQAENEALSYGSAAENPLGLKPLVHGDGLMLGHLSIRVLGTSGHTPGGLSYYIQGLAKPLVVVGDALFASSIGGAPYAYQEAIHNIQSRILTLPPETIVCPGHGPLTTVGEERTHNPFFPDLKA
jgi:hydroxyacylglutathione hydrolase